MARTPTVPPRNQWFRLIRDRDGNVIGVEPTDSFYQVVVGERGGLTNVGTGVNQVRAEVAVAQTTAVSASQTAQDSQSNEFVVTIDTPFLYEAITTLAATTTDSVTVTPSGGTAPYSYAWTKVSGDTLTVNSPSAATTTFTGTPAVENTSLAAVYRCTVTDNAGSPLTASITVPVTISHIGLG